MEVPLDPELLDSLDWGETVRPPHHEAVILAIEALPEELSVVVNAVFTEQLSRRELAKRLGASRGDVDRRLRRALVILRGVLGSEAEPSEPRGCPERRVAA